MKSFRAAFAVATLSVLWSAWLQPAEAESPRPLYNNLPPTRQDPCAFAQAFFVGNCIPFDNIDLQNVPPAASVDDATERFSARAAAAIVDGANTSISDGGLDNELNYSLRILSKMAYADYFFGPDQVLGRSGPRSQGTLRQEVNNSVLVQTPGIVGSSIDRDDRIPATGKTVSIHIHGEYDVLLTAYVKLYYKYYDVLDPKVRNHLFDALLSQRGQYTDSERFSLQLSVLGLGMVTIPETENHRLMIQTAKYLTNQLYYQKSVAEGHPDHHNFDNNRNGNGANNPPMVDVILGVLQTFLQKDFVEYNARNYQDYTMTALLNLASYAYDDRVRLAARMVLDYMSAKVAVSGNDLRRSTPFRRRNEDQHRGPEIHDGFVGSPLISNICCVPGTKQAYEPDPQGAFYAMLAGNTGMLEGHAPENFAFEMIHAGLSDYRVPPSVLDLFVSQTHRRFLQGFHHAAGANENAAFPGESPFLYVNELYAGSPSYLISAGGTPSFYAYTADIAGLSHSGDAADLGVALPTTFMPTSFGTSLDQLFQFGKLSSIHGTEHLCVAPDFACGGPIYVPDAFEPKSDGDATLVRDGQWTFINRGSDGTKPGYYLAIFRVKQGLGTLQPEAPSWGFLEAYDTWSPPGFVFPGSPRLSFQEFENAVKRANPSVQLQLGNDEVNSYTTQSGQTIQFTIAPHSAITSTTAEPDGTVYRNSFAHGSIIASPQSGQSGSGLIAISNPTLGTRITLDMRVRHHPRRIAESGAIESAGDNNEVWVDFGYNGPGDGGDFGDPFKTLTAARDHVAMGGTVNIVPGSSNEPIVLRTPMILRSFPGAATIGRH